MSEVKKTKYAKIEFALWTSASAVYTLLGVMLFILFRADYDTITSTEDLLVGIGSWVAVGYILVLIALFLIGNIKRVKPGEFTPKYSRFQVIAGAIVSSMFTYLSVAGIVVFTTEPITRSSTENFLIDKGLVCVVSVALLLGIAAAVVDVKNWNNSDPTTEGEEDVI